MAARLEDGILGIEMSVSTNPSACCVQQTHWQDLEKRGNERGLSCNSESPNWSK